MPSLLLLVPCEKVSYDSVDQAASLIGIFQGFVLTSIPNEAAQEQKDSSQVIISDRPLIPIRWTVFALWQKTGEDREGQEFEQIVRLITPSGKTSVNTSLKFSMTKRFQRNTIQVHNFPAAESGDYFLKVFLKTESSEEKEIASYPISVTFEQLQTHG